MAKQKRLAEQKKLGSFEITRITGGASPVGCIVIRAKEGEVYALGAQLEDAGFNVRRDGNNLIVHSYKP